MKVLFFLHLIQDIDLVEPILEKALMRPGLGTDVWVTDRVWHYPRTQSVFKKLKYKPRILPYLLCRLGLFPKMSDYQALISPSESNARPHRTANYLAKKAAAKGVKTFTMQQGLDNIGLTYFDDINTPESTDFASQTIFLWGGLRGIDTRVRQAVKDRCVTVGCPKRAVFTELPSRRFEWGENIVAVFENLHRNIYSDSDRNRFLQNLRLAAESFPSAHFILKPHPNRRWSALNGKAFLAGLKNLTIIDPKESAWALWTAMDLISIAKVVITTPSTVALDAARAGRPVAISGPKELCDSRYEPLVFLRAEEVWIAFLSKILEGEELARETESEKARIFASKHILEGDAVERILQQVTWQ